MRVLLIEDDEDLRESLALHFKKENIDLDTCGNGLDGLDLMKESFYEVIILDRMLPELDGLSVLKKARELGVQTPVLVLTALGRIEDRIDGLNIGADDYLVKPFDPGELLARVNALSRRSLSFKEKATLSYGDLTLCPDDLILSGPKGNLSLSPRECSLAECFLKNSNRILNRDFLLGTLWGFSNIVEDANLDTYVCFLRRRFRSLGSNVSIIAKRGVGYRIEYKESKEEN